MQDRELVYIHCKDMQSFLDYQKENPDRNCLHIADEYFLRGRWPARIIVTEDAYSHIMNEPIMESIETHRELWKDDLAKIEERSELGKDDSEDKDFYAG